MIIFTYDIGNICISAVNLSVIMYGWMFRFGVILLSLSLQPFIYGIYRNLSNN